jgi:signal peptidase I
MVIDFSFWLLVLTTVSGLVWAADAALFKKARSIKLAQSPQVKSLSVEDGVSDASYKSAAQAAASTVHVDVAKLHEKAATSHDPILVEYARSFFPVLALVLIVRSFIFEPFRIPSDSMMPTLFDGDFIFVSKFSYDLKMPVFNFKLLETGDPQRGDVVVFKLPSDPAINYIKRLVGLPGDHVQVVNDQVFINGEQVKVELTGNYNDPASTNAKLSDNPGYASAKVGMETLGTVRHQVMYIPDTFPRDFDAVVPAGHYYFMGDNRDNSQDSRWPQVGFVPEKNLVGRAKVIWLHWKFTELPVFSRIGTRIK